MGGLPGGDKKEQLKALDIIAHDESIDTYERDVYLKLRDRIVQGILYQHVWKNWILHFRLCLYS